MNKTALVLFSWWLDSLITIKVLEDQGIDVTALTYETPFFKATKAKALAEHYWFKHIVKDISEPHFEIVKSPRYGYWKNLNPCVDCHGFMFKVARSIAEENNIAIIASWEVFGQRPFSQNKQALINVRIIAWCDVLMPLSAKLLEETSYERQGLVDRNKLYDIKWRSRSVQLELTKKFNLDKFTTPWWWCLLTAHEYSNKLKELLDSFDDKLRPIDAEIIKHWRCKFFEYGDVKYYWIMWRKQNDNLKIAELWAELDANYLMINFIEIPWPRVLLFTFWQEIVDQLLKDVVKWMCEKTQKSNELEVYKIKITREWKEEELDIVL